MEPPGLSFLEVFYSQQTLLLTGASGFVGKVLLAQLLKATPAKKIYVLLRGSRNRSAQERLLNEVFSSPAFDQLKKKLEEHEAWQDHVMRRVEAVPGDLLLPNLGMQEQQLERLREEVTMVIHVAASVHFTAALKDNYRSNVEGTMRVLDFAKTCTSMQVFVQTSTCYVHSDKEGRIKEDIVPMASNIEDLLSSVHQMIELREREDEHPNLDIASMEAQLLGTFPNTYTFTKRLSEALLVREWESGSQQHEDTNGIRFPLCILRPSIVGVAYQHPQRGWIDTLNATGGMLLLCALGVLKCLPANPHLIGDNVPVDMVADSLIVSGAAVAAAHALANPTAAAAAAATSPAAAASAAAAACAVPEYLPRPLELPKSRKRRPDEDATVAAESGASAGTRMPAGAPGVYVFHCGTSDTNPMQWGDILIYGREYSMMNPYFHRLTRMLYTPYFEEDFDDFRRSFFLLQRLPAAVAARLTSYFLPPASRMYRNAHTYQSGIRRVKKIADAFRPFSYREWLFEQRNQKLLQHLLTEEEKKIYLLNAKDIDWRTWTHYFFYGIARWLLGEQSACEPPPPPHLYVNLLHKHVLSEPRCPPGLIARVLPGPDAVKFLRSFSPVTSCPSPEALQQQVLNSKPVLAAQQAEVQRLIKLPPRRRKRKDGKPGGTTLHEIEVQVKEEAQEMYNGIAGTIQPAAVYLMGGLLHTAFLRLFDRIVVDTVEAHRLTKAVQDFKGPIILLPTHRSHLDFLLLFHLCLGNKLPIPFTPMDEKFAKISLVSMLMRRTGTFFVKHKVVCCSPPPATAAASSTAVPPLPPHLYCAVLREYVCAVARKHRLLELFIEGGRSKNGLLKGPRQALLRALADLYFSASQPNVLFVPVTVSYDKVLEAEWLSALSSSSSRTGNPHARGNNSTNRQQSLMQVINTFRSACAPGPDNTMTTAAENVGVQQRFGVGFRPLGSAYIKIAEPISIKEFLQQHVHDSHPAKIYLSAAEEDGKSNSNDWELRSSRQPPRLSRGHAQHQQQQQTKGLQHSSTEQAAQGKEEASSSSSTGSSADDASVTKEVCTMLAEHMSNVFVSNLVISPTSLVAAVLSVHHNGIREEDLVKQVDWLRDQVLLRGGLLSPGLGGVTYDTRLIVQATLRTYLQQVVVARRRNEGNNGRRGWAVASRLRPPPEPQQRLPRLLGSTLRALPAAAVSAAATASVVAAAGGSNSVGALEATAAALSSKVAMAVAGATAAAAATTAAAIAVAPSSSSFFMSGAANSASSTPHDTDEVMAERNDASPGSGEGKRHFHLQGDAASSSSDPRPRIVLAYYRNQCCHIFAAEAAVCVALLSFGCDRVWALPGVSRSQLFERVSFLLELLRGFLVGNKTSLGVPVAEVIHQLVQRAIVCILPHSPEAASSSLAAAESSHTTPRKQKCQQQQHQQHAEEGTKRDSQQTNQPENQGKESEVKDTLQSLKEAYIFHSASEMQVLLLSHFVWPFVDSLWACATALYALQAPQNSVAPIRAEAMCCSPAASYAASASAVAGQSFPESPCLPTVRRALYAFERFGLLRHCNRSSNSQSGEGDRSNNSSQVRVYNVLDIDDEEADSQRVLLELAPPYEQEEKLQEFVDRLHAMRKTSCTAIRGEAGKEDAAGSNTNGMRLQEGPPSVHRSPQQETAAHILIRNYCRFAAAASPPLATLLALRAPCSMSAVWLFRLRCLCCFPATNISAVNAYGSTAVLCCSFAACASVSVGSS